MIIGYARTSTTDQAAGLESQIRDLTAAHAEKIFSEQTSALGTRPQLEAALDFARDGDSFMVTKPDRLARSVGQLFEITEKLTKKGVTLRILSMGVDTSTPTGKLILNVLGSIAQFEREIMLERQREGIAKAQKEGKYKGRKATARALTSEVMRLKASGVKNVDIAAKTGIGIASVYRIFKDFDALQ